MTKYTHWHVIFSNSTHCQSNIWALYTRSEFFPISSLYFSLRLILEMCSPLMHERRKKINLKWFSASCAYTTSIKKVKIKRNSYTIAMIINHVHSLDLRTDGYLSDQTQTISIQFHMWYFAFISLLTQFQPWHSSQVRAQIQFLCQFDFFYCLNTIPNARCTCLKRTF